MTLIDALADLRIAIDEPKHRDRTMQTGSKRRGLSTQQSNPSHQRANTDAHRHPWKTNPQPTQTKPSSAHQQAAAFKETQKPLLFRLFPLDDERQTRRNLIDTKRARNTDGYQDQQQIPKNRFFQTQT